MADFLFGEREMFGQQEARNIADVLDSQLLWRGTQERFVSRFEDAFGEWLGRDYVHTVSAGTAANEAALAGCGIGPGDEVICPPCSFIATSSAIVALGAIPVFADVDPATLIITPEAIEEAVTPNAKAVVVVHLAGQPAQMKPIAQVADKHDLIVIEDAAQAYGPTYRGQKVGTFGDCTSFSLQQGKHITTGEGGMIATDDPEIYRRAVLYANCGMPWYRYGLDAPAAEPLNGVPTRGHFAFGHNYRMTELQGAVALAQLDRLDEFNAHRRRLVGIVQDTLGDVPGLVLPEPYPDTEPIYWDYLCRLEDMTPAELNKRLQQMDAKTVGVYSEVNYLEAVYQQMEDQRRTALGCPLPDYVSYAPGICPQAETAAAQTFSLWTHHAVSEETMATQTDAIRKALTK